MKNTLFLIFNLIAIYAIGQNVQTTNSGAFNTNELIYTVGEVYVNPVNENEANSGIIGVVSRIEFFTLDLNQEIVSADYRVYPNPTKQAIYFSSDIKFKKVYIYNVNGKQIYHKEIKDNKVDLTNLTTGIYYIKTENPRVKPIKIIKN